MKCRNCNEKLELEFLDLGFSPLSNSYIPQDKIYHQEMYFPLKLFVCQSCWLVQILDTTIDKEQHFNADYAYFSSVSSSWLQHCEEYASQIVDKLELCRDSFVIELASNDGYMLQFFKVQGIGCLGIEPSLSTANVARENGIETLVEFFGYDLAVKLGAESKKADLIIANNVLAHVPDINNFVQGVAELLKPGGTATFEFPHLLQMKLQLQFDTAYHEHYSYLSLICTKSICEKHGMQVYDVEELKTHGGSLRLYVQLRESGRFDISENVSTLLEKEYHYGVTTEVFYSDFQSMVNKVKNELLSFLLECAKNGKQVAAYGAAAKGNTLLNYAGVKTDLIECIYDAAESKQGKLMPGSHIPIFHPDKIKTSQHDFIIILPWNISEEITKTVRKLTPLDIKFVKFIPALDIF